MNFTRKSSLGILVASAFALLTSTSSYAQSCNTLPTVEYRVTFDATWSATTHPTDFPPNPHFSGLVGGTHNSNASFWAVGGIATTGIERMAELGTKSNLLNEVQAEINLGNANQQLCGGSIGLSPGSTSFTFETNKDYPLVTLVSMIAPSPDWFVGVSGLDLCQGGQWVDQLVVSLDAYDAGTDSGATYTSPNSNTNPKEPIFEITGYPTFGVPLGTFTFTKISEECLGLCVANLVAGQNASITVTGGTPFETVAVLWSTSLGSYQANSGGWCVDFGLQIPASNPASRLAATGQFDANGEFTATVAVPGSAGGTALKLQAAEMNTCPESCMSNIVEQTVQ